MVQHAFTGYTAIMADDRILLIRTGGTIDSKPYQNPRKPPHYIDTLKGPYSLIMGAVRELEAGDRVDSFSWGQWHENRFVKDSQKFSQPDMNELARIIKKDSRRLFIITHGTDAMANNAAMLKEALKGTDKVVIFTGAMVPLSMAKKHQSDAVPSLEYTLGHIDEQAPGVYLTGRDAKTKRLSIFDPETVTKDKPTSIHDLQFTVRAR